MDKYVYNVYEKGSDRLIRACSSTAEAYMVTRLNDAYYTVEEKLDKEFYIKGIVELLYDEHETEPYKSNIFFEYSDYNSKRLSNIETIEAGYKITLTEFSFGDLSKVLLKSTANAIKDSYVAKIKKEMLSGAKSVREAFLKIF